VAAALTGDHTSLFSRRESFLSERLAFHYGLAPPPGGFGLSGWAWVPYGESARSGVLGQGAVLSNGAKFGDTSPVLRGKFIYERLLCRKMGGPPPEVNANAPPAAAATSRCKPNRYAAHSQNPACASCHQTLDPIGFGLEHFGPRGEQRSAEPGAEECAIAGAGALDGQAFSGPSGLSALLSDATPAGQELAQCMVRQSFRFVFGREDNDADQSAIRDLDRRFHAAEKNLPALFLAIVTRPEFGFRKEIP
jgi:hypothetical protein